MEVALVEIGQVKMYQVKMYQVKMYQVKMYQVKLPSIKLRVDGSIENYGPWSTVMFNNLCMKLNDRKLKWTALKTSD